MYRVMNITWSAFDGGDQSWESNINGNGYSIAPSFRGPSGKVLNFSLLSDRLGREVPMLKGVAVSSRSAAAGTMHPTVAIAPTAGERHLFPLRFDALDLSKVPDFPATRNSRCRDLLRGRNENEL